MRLNFEVKFDHILRWNCNKRKTNLNDFNIFYQHSIAKNQLSSFLAIVKVIQIFFFSSDKQNSLIKICRDSGKKISANDNNDQIIVAGIHFGVLC